MSEQPDLFTLPQRMRYAADVMDEAKRRLDLEIYAEPKSDFSEWHSEALRKRAEIWDAKDRAAAQLESVVEELAQEIHAARWPKHSDPTNGAYLPDYRKAARKLIESGWRKGDPK